MSAPSAVRGRTRTPSTSRHAFRRGLAGYGFVAPYVVLLIAFGVIPTAYAIYFAFTNAGGRFAGLSNFADAAADFRFFPAAGHVARYLLFWLVALVLLVVVLALLLHRMTSRASGTQLTLLRKWIFYMVILAFAAGTQLFVEPELLSQASNGVAGRDYSLNQLTYGFAFQNNNINAAAAVSVELLVVGVAVAGLFVARSGFFDAD